jgi:hypothetical protein
LQLKSPQRGSHWIHRTFPFNLSTQNNPSPQIYKNLGTSQQNNGQMKITNLFLWRKQFSWRWCCVDIVLTDVSDERIASLFKVEEKRRESASEKSVWAPAGSSLADYLLSPSTLKMKAIRSSKTSVNTISTRRHLPEDCFLHSHGRENLRSSQSFSSSRHVADSFCKLLKFSFK